MKFYSTIFLSFILLFSGCSSQQADYSKVGLVDVGGTIRLDGEPVKDAVILLEDLETGLQSYGLTDKSGRYQLQFDSVKSGIIPGNKKVVISTTMKVLGLNSDEEGGEEESEEEEAPEQKPVELIPEEYRKDSKLKVVVEDSTNELNFDLSPDGSTTGPA